MADAMADRTANAKAGTERSAASSPPSALALRGLTVSYRAAERELELVAGVSLDIRPGEIVCLVGESGSGKTLTGRAITGLLRRNPRMRVSGSVTFGDRDLTELPEGKLRRIRGGQIGMIFQDPVAALDPVIRVGDQIAEAIAAHGGPSGRRAVHERMTELLSQVGITDPELRARQFPHELSGGMCQRVLIAIALAGNPSLLIADEPTTALDVTIQAQVLDLLARVRAERGMSILLITHDMGIAAQLADQVVVMYAGSITEAAPVDAFFARPGHPYSLGLVQAVPRVDAARARRLPAIPGSVPEAGERPPGCPFQTRCPLRLDVCEREAPPLERVLAKTAPTETGPMTTGDAQRPTAGPHLVACHRSAELLDGGRPIWSAITAGA
jgi:oligopeptide/dipeptide ABC transporter ATP-binding protein